MRMMYLIAAALLLSACAGSEPTIQQGPDAETSFDGLVRIDNSRFQRAWIDPEVDLKSYTKIIPGNAKFEFRAVKESTRTSTSLGREKEFWISEDNRERLVETVSQIFSTEVFLSSVGEATLVLELRDSLSGETIYRAADRRPIERTGGQAIHANTVTTWSEVRRWARRWATQIVDGLDSIHE
jgi:hypothetical protein